MRKCFATAFLGLSAMSQPAAAEVELGFYLGIQTSPHSRASGVNPDGGTFDQLIEWESEGFELPPYYGIRGTWWRNERFGVGLELTHAKVDAAAADRTAAGFTDLEFTDGLNIITVNAMYRWPGQWNALTPYVGAGLGLSVPHVDVRSAGGIETFEYQLTGPAARLTAGVQYDLNERYGLFGEYQFTYSSNEADLNGGGSLETDIVINSLNFGINLKF